MAKLSCFKESLWQFNVVRTEQIIQYQPDHAIDSWTVDSSANNSQYKVIRLMTANEIDTTDTTYPKRKIDTRKQ